MLYSNLKYFSIVIFLFLFLKIDSVFAQRQYIIPHQGNSLKLQKKGDFHFSFGGWYNDKGYRPVRSMQLQVGYSPIKYLGITLFQSAQKVVSKSDFSRTFYQSYIFGFEVSGFHTLKFQLRRPKKRLPMSGAKYYRIHFNFSPGYAIGSLDNNYFAFREEKPISIVDINFQKLYLQGGVHWIGNRFHLSGMYRLGRVNYYSGIIDGQKFSGDERIISYILKNKFIPYKELSIKAEIKIKNIGIYIQPTVSFVEDFVDFSGGRFDVGFVLDMRHILYKYHVRKNKKKDL